MLAVPDREVGARFGCSRVPALRLEIHLGRSQNRFYSAFRKAAPTGQWQSIAFGITQYNSDLGT